MIDSELDLMHKLGIEPTDSLIGSKVYSNRIWSCESDFNPSYKLIKKPWEEKKSFQSLKSWQKIK